MYTNFNEENNNNNIIDTLNTSDKEQELIISLDNYDPEKKLLIYKDKTIHLYKFIIINKDRYRLIEKGSNIYLQQKCKKCNNFKNVQILKDSKLVNLANAAFTPINKDGGGFKVTCNDCSSKSLKYHIVKDKKDNISQLNIKIDSSIKKELQILCIKQDITLQDLVLNSLQYYKNYITRNDS